MPCPPGTGCNGTGFTLATLDVLPGFWRASSYSEDVLSCPFSHTCAGSKTMPPSYEEFDNAGCTPDRGAMGALCAVCELPMILDEDLESCVPCIRANLAVALVSVLAGLVALVLVTC